MQIKSCSEHGLKQTNVHVVITTSELVHMNVPKSRISNISLALGHAHFTVYYNITISVLFFSSSTESDILVFLFNAYIFSD